MRTGSVRRKGQKNLFVGRKVVLSLMSIAITLEFTVPSVLDSFPADSLSMEETDSDATAENVLFISS